MARLIKLLSYLLVSYSLTASTEPVVQGALDVYWNTKVNSAKTGAAYASLNNNDSSVGLATLNFSGSMNQVEYFIELAYGEQAGGTAAGNSGAQSGLSQAYLTHHLNKKISLIAGRMDSNVGFEGNFAKNNMNYSHSLGFNYGGPNYGEGVAIRYKLLPDLEAAIYYYDGADQLENNDSTHAYSAQLIYQMKQLNIMYNYFAEKDGVNSSLHELFLAYNVSAKFTVSLDAILGGLDEENLEGEWSSIAVYLKYLLAEKNYLALRVEAWEQESIVLVGPNNDEKITSLTLTYGYQVNDTSQLRLEARQDTADNSIFVDDNGDDQDSQTNLSAAWITTF